MKEVLAEQTFNPIYHQPPKYDIYGQEVSFGYIIIIILFYNFSVESSKNYPWI
jgi:hypothetical protein